MERELSDICLGMISCRSYSSDRLFRWESLEFSSDSIGKKFFFIEDIFIICLSVHFINIGFSKFGKDFLNVKGISNCAFILKMIKI